MPCRDRTLTKDNFTNTLVNEFAQDIFESVLRRTLTQFEDSVLAAQFSGRWDDSMEKDRDGNMFVDQDPENFMLLINYLRLRMNNQARHVPQRHLPKPTYSFCYMLEYLV